MTEMETMWGVLAGLELYVECSLRDWYYYLTRTVHTYVKILYDNYVLKQIGRLQLAFKPNIPFTVHVSTRYASYRSCEYIAHNAFVSL